LLVDGLGLGPEDPERNPLLVAEMPCLYGLFEGHPHLFVEREQALWGAGAVSVVTDAVMGVPGLPQSASGQTSILAGENAQALLGYHLNGKPNDALARVLRQRGIFGAVRDAGRRGEFINAFRPSSLERMAKGTYVPSATTVSAMAGGVRLRTFEDLARGEAVYNDITNESVADGERGGIEVITPDLAGRRAAALARLSDFTLFEYFLTDLAGHSRSRLAALLALERLDRFIGAVISRLDPRRDTVVVCSDHGNIEDLGVRTHTRNPVGTIVWGLGHEDAVRIRSLVDIKPFVLELVLRRSRCEGRSR